MKHWVSASFSSLHPPKKKILWKYTYIYLLLIGVTQMNFILLSVMQAGEGICQAVIFYILLQ